MIVRLEDVDALEKQKKHSIELVIDRRHDQRRRPRPPDRLRRDRAPRGQGQDAWSRSPGEKVPRVYSRGERVPDVRHRLPRAVAAEFSFNSPLGMCVECNGLGERQAADPDLVVPDQTRSIRDGRGRRVGRGDREGHRLDDRTSSRRSRRRSRSISTSRGTSSAEKQRDVLMHGTGDKRVNVAWEGRHSTGEWAMRFEGILAQLERRHRESSSRAHAQHYEQFFRVDPVRGVPRHAPAARVARGVRQREADRRRHRHDGAPGVRLHHDDEAHRLARANRGRGAQGDQEPALSSSSTSASTT